MSYNDDEEIKLGELGDDDLDVDPLLHDPLDDDVMPSDDDDAEGFAGLDGSEY